MRRFATLLILIAGVSATDAAPIEAGLADALLQQANKMKDATLSGDYQALVENMNPFLVEQLGGVEKAIEVVEQGMTLMQQQGLSITRYDVQRPEEIYESEADLVVFLPTTMVIESPAATLESTSYLVASRKKDSESWVFLEGSSMGDASALAEIFPGLPDDVKVPETNRNVTEHEAPAP